MLDEELGEFSLGIGIEGKLVWRCLQKNALSSSHIYLEGSRFNRDFFPSLNKSNASLIEKCNTVKVIHVVLNILLDFMVL